MFSKVLIIYLSVFSQIFYISSVVVRNKDLSTAVINCHFKVIPTMPKRALPLSEDALSSDDEIANIRQTLARSRSEKGQGAARRKKQKSSCEKKRRAAKKVRGKKKSGESCPKKARGKNKSGESGNSNGCPPSSVDDNRGNSTVMPDAVMEDTEVKIEDPGWISSEIGGRCDNCCRHHIEDCGPCYQFRMCWISPSELYNMKTPLMTVSYKADDFEKSICLCESCYFFVANCSDDKSRNCWTNVWPSFYWNLLVGRDETNGIPFHRTYSPEYLWRFLPMPVRRYWIKSVREMDIYSSCTIHSPPSFFQDRTNELDAFSRNISLYTSEGFLRALDPARLNGVNEEDCPIPSVLPNVLCPWGCSEFCFASKEMDPSILIQHHLRKAQLNLLQDKGGLGHSSLYLCETSRNDYLRRDDEEVDYVLMNKEWPILPAMRLSQQGGLKCLVCRNHSSAADQKVLYPHPPRKMSHKLSSVNAANFCHSVLRPRSFKPVRASKCGSQTSIRQLVAGFTGIDTANITSDRRFARVSHMLYEDEILSIKGRRDMRDLSDVLVDEKKIDPEMRERWMNGARDRFDNREEELRSLVRGSTYCPTKHAIILQTHASDTSTIEAVVPGKKVNNCQQPDQLLYVPRSWDPIIYNLQVEDGDNYGTPIKAIRPYQCYDDLGRQVSMMLWSLVGMVSGCADLHYAMDQKKTPHHYNGVSGHLLTHINSDYMKHRVNNSPKNSPFSSGVALDRVKNALYQLMPNAMKSYSGTSSHRKGLFYRFGIPYFKNIFPVDDYPCVSVQRSVTAIQNHPNLMSEHSIFIIVSTTRPTGEANFELPSAAYFPSKEKYEARVVIGISPDSDEDRNKFTGFRFVRHGNGFVEWWKDERHTKSRQLMTQYVKSSSMKKSFNDPFPIFPSSCDFFLTVYVKVENKLSDSYRFDLYRSLGMQTKVLCNCVDGLSPIIVSGRAKDAKRACTTLGCDGKESHACPKFRCGTCICSKCFERHSKSAQPVILDCVPCDEGGDTCEANESMEQQDEEEEEDSDDDDSECSQAFWGDSTRLQVDDDTDGSCCDDDHDDTDNNDNIAGGLSGGNLHCDAASHCSVDEEEIDREFDYFEEEGVGYDNPSEFRAIEDRMSEAERKRRMMKDGEVEKRSVDVMMENYVSQ